MKKIVVIACSLLLMASCMNNSKKKDAVIEGMSIKTDSLENIITSKDSVINDALMTISDISASINDIKQREGLIVSQAELNKVPKDQIKNDLEEISAILKQNKERIAKLERTSAALAKANIKIDGLTKLVEEMSKQLQERNAVIAEMTANIDNLKAVIASLNKDIDNVTNDNKNLNVTVKEQDSNLHKAYYIVGNEKNLIESGILIKKGIVGRTLVINPELKTDLLTEVDIRNLDRIEIKGKKVEIIGGFPNTSYTLERGDARKEVDALIIKDRKEFWSNSKILVVSYK